MFRVRRDRTLCVALCCALLACSDNAGSSETAPADEPVAEDHGPVREGLEITSIELSQSVVQPLFDAGEIVDPRSFL